MTNISRRVFSEFTGIPYADADCVDLLIDVQQKVFGRKFSDLPTDRKAWRRRALVLLREHCESTGRPIQGDLVVMRDLTAHYPGHVGTYFELAGEGWVLHTTERTDSTFHRARDLANYSIIIEGYFRWKTA